MVAIRLWVDPQASDHTSFQIHTKRIQLELKGDNIGSLALALRLRPKGPNMAIIAREVALSLVHMSFPPKATHTPGVANVLADLLSRVHEGQTENLHTCHPALKSAEQSVPEPRPKEWYRTLHVDDL